MARILGLDFGERRLGFAISDPGGVVATPLRVVEVENERQARAEIVRLCAETGAGTLVIGLPLHLDGGLSEKARQVQAFRDKLAGELSIPIALWDERLTTRSAEQALLEGGARRKKRREVIDKLAAQIMLQHYLDAKQSGVKE